MTDKQKRQCQQRSRVARTKRAIQAYSDRVSYNPVNLENDISEIVGDVMWYAKKKNLDIQAIIKNSELISKL